MIDGTLECCTNKRRKARSDHKCSECFGIIQKGETYQFVSGLWEGKWETYKTCQDCEELRDEYNKDLTFYERSALGELFCEIEEDQNEELRNKAVAILKKRHKKFPQRFEYLLDHET